MTRVAVQVGRAWTRVAAEGRLVAELVLGTDQSTALAGLFDGPVDELVVVQAAGARSPVVAELPARVVRTVPAAVAALALHELALHAAAPTGAARAAVPVRAQGVVAGYAGPPARPVAEGPAGDPAARAVVVDVGHGGAEVTLVRAGRPAAVRRVPVGGARLDVAAAAVLAEGGRHHAGRGADVREALSLLPEVRAGTPRSS